jgi:hypothetical protein
LIFLDTGISEFFFLRIGNRGNTFRNVDLVCFSFLFHEVEVAQMCLNCVKWG